MVRITRWLVYVNSPETLKFFWGYVEELVKLGFLWDIIRFSLKNVANKENCLLGINNFISSMIWNEIYINLFIKY